MTVKQLIEILSSFPEDAPVLIESSGGEYSPRAIYDVQMVGKEDGDEIIIEGAAFTNPIKGR